MQGRFQIFLIFLSVLTPHCCLAGIATNKITITHLRGPIYVVEDGYWVKENSVFYVGKESVTVISASWTPAIAKEIVSKIKMITDKPIRHVVDTHFHVDRAGGNAYFKEIGAKIISTVMTKELMQLNWKRNIENSKKSWPGFPDVPLVLPDITFTDKYLLDNGHIQLLYLGPSHTKDDIVAFFPKEEVLYASCILKEKLGNLNDADLVEYPKTLRKIKQLRFNTIVAGHFTALHGPELIDKYLALLSTHAEK